MIDRDSRQWEDVIRGLKRRSAEAEAEVERLDAFRRPLVLLAKTGDAVAKAQVNGATERVREARREWSDLKTALVEAEAALLYAREQEAHTLHLKRVEEARELARERLTLAAEIDQHMKALGKAVEDYWSRGTELEGYQDAHGLTVIGVHTFPLRFALAEASRKTCSLLDVQAGEAGPLLDYETDLWSKLLPPEPPAPVETPELQEVPA